MMEAQERTTSTGTEPEQLEGDFYIFVCMNAFLSDRLFSVSAFEGDREAIRTAENYEATLYRVTATGGEITDSRKLYDPWDCFND